MPHPNPNTKITNLFVSLVKIQLECNLNKLFIGGSKTKELLRDWNMASCCQNNPFLGESS